MIKVTRKESPISSLFDYEIGSHLIRISIKRLNLSKPDHFKKAKNLICWAIILYNKNPQGDLRDIIVDYNQNSDEEELLLQLLHHQAKFFDINVTGSKNHQPFVFSSAWRKGIEKSIDPINTDIDAKKGWLSENGIIVDSKLQFYQTVSNSRTQVRIRGYQFGEWRSSDGAFTSVNDKNDEPRSISAWAEELKQKRFEKGTDLFKDKAEHYMESEVLEMIEHGDFWAAGERVFKIFDQAEVSFQFPALLYGGASSSVNSAKYIDVLGKTHDSNRPVFLELKVFNKDGGTGRGEYLFEAVSQVVCYANYYMQLKQDSNKEFQQLGEMYNLDWDRPILAVVVNNIGTDDTATEFRKYMSWIQDKFKHQITFEFIEIEAEAWIERRVRQKRQ